MLLVAAFGLPGGCLSGLLPANALSSAAPDRSLAEAFAGAVLYRVPGVEDTGWLEIPRRGEAGVVGGYVSLGPAVRPALILILDGASTFEPTREVGAALSMHRDYAADFRAAGYRTWSLALRECPTAYGEGDLADFLEIIDWLDAGGRDALGLERVYAIGYSTGATVVNLASSQRRLDAWVSLGGLSSGDQLRAYRPLYALLAATFAANAGMCQLGETLRRYGPDASPAWEILNAVARIGEIRDPMLFIHGDLDVVFVIENTRVIESRYLALRAGGADLPELTFDYVPGGTHFELRDQAANRARILAFFEQFEPRAP